MIPDPQDTIVALASAPGSGARAVIRLSGPDAVRAANRVLTSTEPILPHARRRYPATAALPGMAALPADVCVWAAPRSYTGQLMVEIHTLSCPPLVELLITQLLGAGVRAAQPGEFTLRAFLAGKLDLTRAEAVAGVIEAGSRAELRQALAQLAGGVTRPLQELRGDLLDLLADVEAGLDFVEEDIHFVQPEELLRRLAKAMALITNLRRQVEERTVARRTFRVVLAGRPNAGKSSLFNALTGAPAALVSPEPGTTRDYLTHLLELDGVAVELVDTAGWQQAWNAIDEQAQSLGREQASQADLVLLCVEAGQPLGPEEAALPERGDPPVMMIATKCDLASARVGVLATSAVTGQGLEELRQLLAEQIRRRRQPALAPSLGRCRHHVDGCLGHLRQAHAAVLFQEPPELVALELRGALEQLGEMVGAVYTDDLLDRIFSRFCIGK
jgi:tRNA modification GTPase